MNVNELMFLLNEEQREKLNGILDTVLGVDIGTSFVKTSTGVIFPSNVYFGEKADYSIKGSIQVIWNNNVYTIGDSSKPHNIKLIDYSSIITAIALGFEGKRDIKVRLALGLSPMYFNNHCEKLKEEVMKLHKQTILINAKKENTSYNIEILDVHVFQQACTLPGMYGNN